MNATGKLIVGALTDFVLTTGTALVAVGHNPDSWGWIVAVIGGIMASAKHVRGMMMDIER